MNLYESITKDLYEAEFKIGDKVRIKTADGNLGPVHSICDIGKDRFGYPLYAITKDDGSYNGVFAWKSSELIPVGSDLEKRILDKFKEHGEDTLKYLQDLAVTAKAAYDEMEKYKGTAEFDSELYKRPNCQRLRELLDKKIF